MSSSAALRPAWQRWIWLGAGGAALALGVLGIFLPLLPTTPFVLLAAFCFTRGSPRCEAWLLGHPRLGPIVRDWRATRAVPWAAKVTAWAMMAIGAGWAYAVLPAPWRWLPLGVCVPAALWLARLPTRL